MHCSPMNIQSSTTPSSVTSPTQPRAFGHKRRRSATSANPAKQQDEDNITSATESCCTTSGESSGDESDDSLEELIEDEEEETLVAVKRRRRADLDGLKKSVRRMEAQVVSASAQLKDLAAVVAQVVARRRLQQSQRSARECVERCTVDTHLAKQFSSL